MTIARFWTLTGSATQSRRNGGGSAGGPFNAPGGWGNGGGSVATAAVNLEDNTGTAIQDNTGADLQGKEAA